MQQVGTTTFVHIATTVYAYRYLDIYICTIRPHSAPNKFRVVCQGIE